MIYSVTSPAEGEFLINDSVKVSNLKVEDEGVTYTVDYNEEDLTEQEAIDMVEEMLMTAIENYKVKNK